MTWPQILMFLHLLDRTRLCSKPFPLNIIETNELHRKQGHDTARRESITYKNTTSIAYSECSTEYCISIKSVLHCEFGIIHHENSKIQARCVSDISYTITCDPELVTCLQSWPYHSLRAKWLAGWGLGLAGLAISCPYLLRMALRIISATS